MSTSPRPSSTASSSGPRAAHLRSWSSGPARLTTPLLTVGLLVLAAIAILVGPYPLSLADALRAVSNRLSGEIPPTATTLDTVLFFVRLPRVAAAMLVGAALAAAGAAYQGLFRNPLVSPDILGVSAGAGLGAVLGIFLSLPVVGIQLLAFLVGLGTVGLVLLIAASVRGREPVLVLVLAGVVVGALAGSVISLLKVLADPYDQLPAITFWLLGSLAAIKLEDLTTTVPVAALGLVPLALLRWRINVLSLGDEEARALGINAGRLRMVVIAAATLMTASVVAIAGIIGWVGLIMPHMARMLVGPNFDRLLPAAMILGAGYLLLVDTLARTIAAVETPIGILTAFVGAPVFLWLLARGRHGWA
jgi:iron complex transport system permease protein